MSAIRERVTAGEAVMDDRDPGWWRDDIDQAINLDTLDLNTTDCCVLGQRCPLDALAEAVGAGSPDMLTGADYDEAYGVNAVLTRGGLPSDTWGPIDSWAASHGFTGSSSEMDALTAEWKRIIIARREAAAATGEQAK
jgi:hypothetical protein